MLLVDSSITIDQYVQWLPLVPVALYELNITQCWRFGEVPKVALAMASFDPLPLIPNTQMDESGTLLLANDTAVPPLLFAGLLVCEKVSIPVFDTR